MSKKRLFFLLFGFVLLSACNMKGKQLNDQDIIPQEKMIRLMADIEITEAGLRFKQTKISGDSLTRLKSRAFDSLYIYHQVTPAQFKNSLAFYQKKLDNFERMMDEVMQIITREKDSINNMKSPPADSVKNNQ